MRPWILAFVLLAACTKTPEEASRLFVVQVSNGFTTGGGVVVVDQHVLAHRKVLTNADQGIVIDSQGRQLRGRILSEDPELEVILMYVEELTDSADIGLSGDLLKGDNVFTQVYDGSGTPQESKGRVVGWQYHRGKAYMETDLGTPAAANGAGIFGPYGRLIGIQAFKLGSERTFILPIEYLTNGPRAMLTGVLGEREDDPAFAATRASASNQVDPITVRLAYDELETRRSGSRSALVGSITMLDSKAEPSRKKVAYRLEAVDARGAKRTVAQGEIAEKDRRWVPQPERFEAITQKMSDAFGEIWVEDNLAKNDYGELRYRIPVTPFCANVVDGDTHALTVTLADGRTTGRQVFFDMAAVCGGTAGGEGEAWESSWFSGPPTEPSDAATPAEDGPYEGEAAIDEAPAKGKKKRKGRKKRKGKRKKKKGRKKKRR
jgi:hypothetical protein